MAKIHFVVGVPGAGKTWVIDQLGDKYHVVRRDGIKGSAAHYVARIHAEARTAQKELLIESPFGEAEIRRGLTDLGHDVQNYFLVEKPRLLAKRYHAREGKTLPSGHLTRQNTYRLRAQELGAPIGTAEEILDRLR